MISANLEEEEEEDNNDDWGQFIVIDNNGELLTRLKNFKQLSAHEQMSSFVVFCLFIFIFSVLV